jgi:hypothetical protein
MLNALWHELPALNHRLLELDREIGGIATGDPVAQRLQQLRGVGPFIVTAVVATIGDAKHSSFAS